MSGLSEPRASERLPRARLWLLVKEKPRQPKAHRVSSRVEMTQSVWCAYTYHVPAQRSDVQVKALRALPLSPEAFAAFGQVIQGYEDLNSVPRNVRVTSANQGSANKFHKISLLESSYPENVQATTGLSVYRCQPIDAKSGGHWDIKVLERHLHTNQAFIPMGAGSPNEGDQGLKETAKGYLVVVAQNGQDDRPDLETMRAFIATSAQGIMYNTGIWRKSSLYALRSQ